MCYSLLSIVSIVVVLCTCKVFLYSNRTGIFKHNLSFTKYVLVFGMMWFLYVFEFREWVMR